jgi:hypothetical protein
MYVDINMVAGSRNGCYRENTITSPLYCLGKFVAVENEIRKVVTRKSSNALHVLLCYIACVAANIVRVMGNYIFM